jgi:Methyltransferase domain
MDQARARPRPRRWVERELPLINRTMDRADLEEPRAGQVCAVLNALVVELGERGLRASSWYGGLEMPADMAGWERTNRGLHYEPLPDAADDDRYPWFLYWEIAWLVINNRFLPGQRLLDLGGSSSLFSCYMASIGLDVVTLDLDQRLVANGDQLAAATGWNLRNLRMDMRELRPSELGGRFDHITSVCVFEHLPVSGRIESSRRISELLVDGGSFSITFDYLNPSRLARIGSPADVEEQFVAPTGLRVRGNREFHDNGRRYLLHPFHHPRARSEGWQRLSIELGQFQPERAGEVRTGNEYTFGALFQERG